MVMVMVTPVLPIIVAEGLDIKIFQSIEDAERWLEPWWVEEGLGKAYDAQGRLIRLHAGDKRVTFQSWEEEPTHAKELKVLLLKFLKAANSSDAYDETCDLQHLIAKSKIELKGPASK